MEERGVNLDHATVNHWVIRGAQDEWEDGRQ